MRGAICARAAHVKLLATLAAASAGLMLQAAPASATTTAYSYTGAEQTFIVPSGVTSVQITAVGGTGGGIDNFPGSIGGAGAVVTDTLSGLTPGTPLYVEVLAQVQEAERQARDEAVLR